MTAVKFAELLGEGSVTGLIALVLGLAAKLTAKLARHSTTGVSLTKLVLVGASLPFIAYLLR